MADVVQYRMERMSDELDDLERRGLFSRAELAEVVRRRRDFEFRLRRPSPLRRDYLAYISYERSLDALRRLRKRAILRAQTLESDAEEKGRKGKKGKKWKRSISDIAGVLRVLDIYRLATIRYKGDLDLWFQYLEFCREKRHGRMKQVLAQAIRYHPKIPGLWIYAASWEFDQNLNVAAARALMQSGLRSCLESEDLWIEYLRMELTYLNKLKARKIALGQDVETLPSSNNDDSCWKEENKELFMSLNEQGEAGEESDLQEVALEKKEDVFWQQGLLIIQTIYHGAVEALPASLTLRKRFLEILDSVDLAHSDELKIEVMDDLKKAFSHDEDYWDWFGRRQFYDSANCKNLSRKEVSNKLKKAIQVYDEATKGLPTAKMFSLYAKFLMDVVFPAKEDSISLLSDAGVDSSEFASSVLNVYEKAESRGCLTEELACQYVSFYLQLGRLEEARDLAEKLCNGPLSCAADLWTLRASIEAKFLATSGSSSSKASLSSLFDLLKCALSKLPISKAEGLWHMAIKLFCHEKVYFEKVVSCAMLSLSTAGGNDCGASISCAIIGAILQRDDIQQARQMYKRFLALPHPSIKFFQYCIQLEVNLASIGNNDALANARKLYDSAIGLYSQDRELWRNYYKMELKVGTSETANAVYWRARKVLNDSTALAISDGQ